MGAPPPADPAGTRCPLCNKPLATDEYERAVTEMEDRIRQRYAQGLEAEREAAARAAKESDERHAAEVGRLRAEHEKSTAQLQKNLEDGQAKQMAALEKRYDRMAAQSSKQMAALEKRYDRMAAQSSKQMAALEKRLKAQHQKDIAARDRQAAAAEKRRRDEHRRDVAERDRQIKDLKSRQAADKRAAADEARAGFDSERRKLREDLTAKDIQLRRFEGEVGQLKEQLRQSQPELRGEAGELDLYAALTAAFPDDHFKRQRRGTRGGDIVQRIRSRSGFLDTPIVYDNKSAATVTKADIEKAQGYRLQHGTEYVLVVSASLPKRSVPNGLVGEKDGVLLVHPSIVAEVARQIRSGIVEVSRYSLGAADREGKQARLYDYVIGAEFASTVGSIAEVQEKVAALQSKEERDHQTLWKTRRALHERLERLYADMSSGIESITHGGLSVEPLPPGGARGVEGGPPTLPPPEALVVRRGAGRGRRGAAGGREPHGNTSVAGHEWEME